MLWYPSPTKYIYMRYVNIKPYTIPQIHLQFIMKKLVNKEIDREFHTDLGKLSERELETYIGECLSSINRDIDSKLDKESLTSHRKIL